jgi:hypothetical protein
MRYKRNAEAARRAALEKLATYDLELGIWLAWLGSQLSTTPMFCALPNCATC